MAVDELLKVGIHVLENEIEDGPALLQIEQEHEMWALRQHPQQRHLP